MTIDTLRALCLSFPGATEQIQWGADLVFKVGGKMFCVVATQITQIAQMAPTEAVGVALSFKCDDETFAELVEQDGVIPAPYLARAKWVALERMDTLPSRQLAVLIRRSYDLVRAKLPTKTRRALGV